MTSAEIRQSFTDFFKSKQHTIVRSSSLMPDAPNLLFTNAGMNQFVPFFLGQQKPDVSKWTGADPALDTRAADTQKCIRAGGKHNDLDDVGLDTYHHTFFEMLGNWSYGDYFKKEAIEFAWELLTQVWKLPKERLYVTVYKPGPGDPAEFDQEAYDHWSKLLSAEGLDPKTHIVFGGKKDNFWMMGDTGPCGPCSEIHMDLTPKGDTGGALVNGDSSDCIELWNLVFIQFNANPDRTFSPLPSCHVDTGMGFERVTSILQCTRNLTHFGGTISNYETDIFRPLFDQLENLSRKSYTSSLPKQGSTGDTEQEKVDVAFRVIADHIRTLSFAIADGIEPGNTDRNYVLRRILRRAVRYGRTLGLHEPFFYRLVDTLAASMGHVFPEIVEKQGHVRDVIRREEEAFNKTLDDGLRIFEEIIQLREGSVALRKNVFERFALLEELEKKPNATLENTAIEALGYSASQILKSVEHLDRTLLAHVFQRTDIKQLIQSAREFCTCVADTSATPDANDSRDRIKAAAETFKTAFFEFLQVARRYNDKLNGAAVFLLYDTYGFPVDLTELMARERGLAIDIEEFNELMEQQRERARKSQKKTIIEVSQVKTDTPTQFVGFDQFSNEATVLEIVTLKDQTGVILDTSACYAEMGGQIGDAAELVADGKIWRVLNTQKHVDTWIHLLQSNDPPEVGQKIQLNVDRPRRDSIQRHHSVTHLLHWALHEVVGPDVTQKGSFVGVDKLTFDFNSAPLTPEQISQIEKLVNDRILDNAPVCWTEIPYADVRNRKDILQFFGDKYGDVVRVVQIGGTPGQLDGYSMELCGGTHTRATGEIGLFRILNENAIAAGVRRMEAVAGWSSYGKVQQELGLIQKISERLNTPVTELEQKIDSMITNQKDLEKALKVARQKEAGMTARSLLSKIQTIGSVEAIIENLGPVDAAYLQGVIEGLKPTFQGIVVLGGTANHAVALTATVASSLTKQFQAGKIIQAIVPIVNGRGGGRPDNARGGGKDPSKLDDALAKASEILQG